MAQSRIMLVAVGLVVLILVLVASTFVVNQWQVAIKLRLGEIVSSDYKPGLHFMVPILNNVKKFDGRIQTHDSRPQRFLTIEKKDVIVDYYAKWRISDAGQFFRSTGGDPARTARLLSERINTSLRDEFGKRTIQEVVSEDRQELMEELTKVVDRNAGELGVEVIDVRVKKIDLPPEVSESVYERMRAERERVARDLRAKGSEAAERIRADADRQRTVILADAYKVSEEVRGEGDAKAAEIYAGAYQQNAPFYSFYRSLSAYRSAFGQGGDLMVLQPDAEFFRYFRDKGVSEAATAPETLGSAPAAPASRLAAPASSPAAAVSSPAAPASSPAASGSSPAAAVSSPAAPASSPAAAASP